MSPLPPFGSRGQVFTVPKKTTGGGGGVSPSGTGPPAFGGRSQVFNVQGIGGGGGVSPSGVGPPVHGSRSQVFMVLPDDVTLCACGITDTFNRAVVSGWGTCDVGTLWFLSLGGSSTASVDGTVGIITNSAGASASADLTVATTGETDAVITVDLSALPSDDWRLKFTVLPGGANAPDSYCTLIFGGAFAGFVGAYRNGNEAAGTFTPSAAPFNVRIVASMTETKVKVWLASDTEPVTWNATNITNPFTSGVSDGFWGVVVNPATVADSLTVRFDNLAIVGVDTCVFDNFMRAALPSSWGLSTPTGYTWTNVYSQGAVTPSVSGGQGYLTFAGIGGGQVNMETNADIASPWSGGKFVMTALVRGFLSRNESVVFFLRNPATAGVGEWTTWFSVSNDGIDAELLSAPTYSEGGSYQPLPYPQELDGDYIFVWEHKYGAYSRAKWWLVGDPEPIAWIVSRTALLDEPPSGTWKFGINTTNFTKSFDYVKFLVCP